MAAPCSSGPSSAKVRSLLGSVATSKRSSVPIGDLSKIRDPKTREGGNSPENFADYAGGCSPRSGVMCKSKVKRKETIGSLPSPCYYFFAFVALVSPLGKKAVARSHLRLF